MKFTNVLTDGSNGILGNLDNTATKAILATQDTLSNGKQEIALTAIGLGIMVGAKALCDNLDFMSQAVDGVLEVTDIAEAGVVLGGAIGVLGAASLASKFSKNYENLSQIDDMSDEEFEKFLNTGSTKIPKKLDTNTTPILDVV